MDPTDKRSWSGTYFRMLNSLKEEFNEVIPLGPVEINRVRKIPDLIDKLVFKIFRKKYNKSHNILCSLAFFYKFREKLKKEKYDVIFAPAASTEIAMLRTKIPICYLSDTSFNQIKDYYTRFSNLVSFSVYESNIIEKKAIGRSKTLVYSSDWASGHVIDFYKAPEDKVHIVPFGANIDTEPSAEEIKEKFNYKEFKLLFLGVDWERKGGAIAFEAFNILLSEGFDVKLTIVGCAPSIDHEKVEIIPFLDKNIAEQYTMYYDLLKSSQLLFVPTRADCTPMVFCEASAFGMPVITTDTGGVKSVVENGINGYCLAMDAGPEEYAEIIRKLINDKKHYMNLIISSREQYEKHLNWKNWGNKMKEILKSTYDSNK